MNILHGDFRFSGDNRVGDPAATVFATATRDRSDSGSGVGAKIKGILHAGAGLLTNRIFGIDFDDCRTLGRYAVAQTSARISLSFVFTPDPSDLSASSLRRLKTNLVPSLSPHEGRDRFLPARIAQAGFPSPPTAGASQ